MKTNIYHSFVCLALAGLLFALAVSGCSSPSGSGSGSFAAVTIQEHSVDQIAAATAQVFGAAGYAGGADGPGKMVFEKAASRATSFAREGLVAAGYGAQTINRVRIEIVTLADNSRRLECKAYMVTGGSDPFFQNEVPVTRARSGPYQSLLEKVKKQLN
jgi:hypothetical protein